MAFTPSSRAACPLTPCDVASITNNPLSAIAARSEVGSPTIAKSMIEIENNFEVSIIKPETHNHIYYCAYVKTNNGYEYGNILKY